MKPKEKSFKDKSTAMEKLLRKHQVLSCFKLELVEDSMSYNLLKSLKNYQYSHHQ